jgi:hypothetical protein
VNAARRRAGTVLGLALSVVVLAAGPALGAVPGLPGSGTTGGNAPIAEPVSSKPRPVAKPKPTTKPPPSSRESVTTIFLPGPNAKCPSTNGSGDPLVGVLLRIVVSFETTGEGTAKCVYATPTSVRSIVCGLDIAARYTGVTGNPEATPRTVDFPTTTTSFGAGERTLAACNESQTASFLAEAKDWGHHLLVVSGRQVRCEVVSYADAPTRIRSCGKPYVSSGMTARLTVWCGGWERGHTNRWPWTADACKDETGPGSWSCSIPDPTVDGRPVPERLFADGKAHVLSVGAGPAAPGLGNAKFRQGRLVETKTSTPKRPAWEETATGVSDWSIRWWGGSHYDRSWQAAAAWTVDGTVTYSYPVSVTTRIDSSFTVTSGTATRATIGTCSTDLSIHQSRSRSVNG